MEYCWWITVKVWQSINYLAHVITPKKVIHTFKSLLKQENEFYSIKLQVSGIYVPSNRVISSMEGKFVTDCKTSLPVLERLFMKISNLCKNHL
jgi:hypothetical protein